VLVGQKKACDGGEERTWAAGVTSKAGGSGCKLISLPRATRRSWLTSFSAQFAIALMAARR